MSTTLPHAPGEFGEPPVRPATGSGRGPGYYAFKALKAVASLQLTVGLFALSLLLIFFGTLAQLDFGIWTVVDQYFYSLIVWVPFDLIHKLPRRVLEGTVPGRDRVGVESALVPVAGRTVHRRGDAPSNLLAAHRDPVPALVERLFRHLPHPRRHHPPIRRRVHHPRIRRGAADDDRRGAVG